MRQDTPKQGTRPVRTHKIAVPLVVLAFFGVATQAQEPQKLSGTVIGTEQSMSTTTKLPSTTKNTREMAFDDDLSTFFASWDDSRTWCGLDLGTPHVITRLAWSPRNDKDGGKNVLMAVFEGANEEDFSDAVPLYINDTEGTIGEYQYADVNVSKGFRYVRYIGPEGAHCYVAEVEFYGYESEGSDERFYLPSGLPVVSVHIEDAAEPNGKSKEDYLNCSVTLIPCDEGDTLKTKTALIRYRGNNYSVYDKKPYRIKFDKKHHVFDSPASAKKWNLINNHCDKTLMRNIIAFELSRRIGMEYTPYCRPVDLLVNGEYRGCYQLCDQVDVRENRLDIEEMDSTCTTEEELTGGYLVTVDAYASSDPNHFTSSGGNPVSVKYPDSDDITTEQTQYIKEQFNAMEDVLFADGFTDEDSDYRQRIDIESFLKYFLVGEFSGNTDNYWQAFMYKRRSNDHFYMGPIWDMELGFENDGRTYPINDHSDYVYTFGSVAGNMTSFVNRIIYDDPRTESELAQLWADARTNRGWKLESILQYIDETAELIYDSQRLNFIRWPILSTRLGQNWQASGNYEGELQIVKDYIAERIDWLDEKLGYDPLTGIASASPEASPYPDGIVYTLDGRAITTSTPDRLPKGIYVRQGKKFVVR